MNELQLKDEVYAVVGAAMEVYNVLGHGFLEAVYQEAMELELTERRIPFEPQKLLTIMYKGRCLKKEYITDLMCFSSLIVELKVMERLTPREEAQLLNYMHATGVRVGVLINFGHSKGLDWKRMVL